MFVELLRRYAKWIVSNPMIATIGLFTHSLALFVFCQIVISLLLVLRSPYHTPEYPISVTDIIIGFTVITPASLLFGVFVWYYNRSKKEQ
jgi:hypothetical protein